MTTATLPAPATPDVDSRDPHHAWCCNPDLSLCGLDISHLEEITDCSLDEICPTCLAALEIGGPCGAPDCPNRRPA